MVGDGVNPSSWHAEDGGGVVGQVSMSHGMVSTQVKLSGSFPSKGLR